MKVGNARLVALMASIVMTAAAAPVIVPNAFAGETSIVSGEVLARRVNIGAGKSVIIDLPRDSAEIFVANPRVANAVVRSPRKLYLMGMGQGQTTIFAMDAQGRQIAVLEVSIGRDIGDLSNILKTAMPSSNIQLRTVNDTIILTGEVDSPGEAQKALDIARGFVSQANSAGAAPAAAAGGTSVSVGGAASAGANDGKIINSLVVRGRDQVMLRVTIAEVQRQVLKQLGLTSSTLSGGWGTFTQDNPLPLNLQNLSNSALALSGSAGATSLASTIKAFERNTVARILAEPTVTAVSGESAKFTAGGELPVPQSQSCSSDTLGRQTCTVGLTFKPYGVTLNFTPVVMSEGRILLRVATEVTEVDNTQNFTFSTINVPAFRTRKNETSVELPSGSSIVSAGLLQTKSRQIINGLPGLMNLPILGSLFRSRDYQREETELMIIVTPFIAKPSAPQALVRPDDGFADASDPQTWLLGRVNRIYSTASNPQMIKNYKGRVGFIND